MRKTGTPGAYTNPVGAGLYLGDYNTADHADRDDFYTVAIWDRALSSAELAEWTANPWQLFRADPLRIYSFPTGAITLNSLTMSAITQNTARATLGLTR